MIFTTLHTWFGHRCLVNTRNSSLHSFLSSFCYVCSVVLLSILFCFHVSKHYSPGLGELVFNGKSTEVRNLRVLFDSGSSYTYLNSQAYQALLYMVLIFIHLFLRNCYQLTVFWIPSISSLLICLKSLQVHKELSGKPLKEALDDKTLPFCWKGRKPFKYVRDVKKYFKPFAISFPSSGRSRAQFDIPPEGYLIISVTLTSSSLNLFFGNSYSNNKNMKLTILHYQCAMPEQGKCLFGSS